MTEKSPVKEAISSESIPVSNSNQPNPSTQFSTKFTSPTPPNSDIPSTPTGLPPPVETDVIHIPSYSRWFSCEKIDSRESNFLPEFFDGRSSSKNPSLYMHYRNYIIKLFRENPSRKITFTDARKTLVGDVGSVRRVFDFLDHWGLINYSALSKPSKETASNNKSTCSPSSAAAAPAPNSSSVSRRLCGGCKTLCTIACFVCDKYDSTLCARCYVKGNFTGGLSNGDFRRVEIRDDSKANWSEKETLLLLEAVTHYGDDWKKVARHVGGGRTDKDCVSHFVKLPFGEEYLGHPFSNDDESGFETNKKMRLTPLADASNPIMAQAAFLSALAGVEIAEAAAKAAVTILSEVDGTTASTGGNGSLERNTKREPEIPSNGDTNQDALERAYADVNSLLDEEERDIERAITGIIEVQMKDIQDRIHHFEEMDLQIEKERQQLESMKNLLFIYQLNLSFTHDKPIRGLVDLD